MGAGVLCLGVWFWLSVLGCFEKTGLCLADSTSIMYVWILGLVYVVCEFVEVSSGLGTAVG